MEVKENTVKGILPFLAFRFSILFHKTRENKNASGDSRH